MLTLIKNAQLVNEGRIYKADVLIENKTIKQIASKITIDVDTIIDAEGFIVPAGVTGELCTRGYSVMRGYWNDEKRTSDAIDISGWMHTGDLATMDESGYFNIVGRIKDMVIRGGENLYPREIEEFLFQFPKKNVLIHKSAPSHL